MAPPTGGRRKRPGSDDANPHRDPPHQPQDFPSGRTLEQRSTSSYNEPRGGHDGRRHSTRGGRYPRHSTRDQITLGPGTPMAPEPARNSTGPYGQNGARAATQQQPSQGGASMDSKAGVSQPTASSTSQQMVAPTAPTPDPLSFPPVDYPYKFLTLDAIESGPERLEVVVLEAYTKALQDDDQLRVCFLCQELARSGLDRRIDPTQAGVLVKKLIESTPEGSKMEPAEKFLDTISVILSGKDLKNPALVPLIVATDISHDLMRLILEEGLLKALGLVRETFGKMFIRKQTNILYRQSNYNLLREETEGYSKLMTMLFTVSQPEELPIGVVGQTLENVKALIGTFDLDAGRVLDVTLDVFANMLVKKNRFFVKLLRASPYWPQGSAALTEAQEQSGLTLPVWASPDHTGWDMTAEEARRLESLRQGRDRHFWDKARKSHMNAFFGLGGRQILDEVQKSEAMAVASDDTSQNRAYETTQWIEKTGTVPPPGSAVAAQLLGFKLRFYASPAREKEDTLPNNLIWMTALLIKIGFISLRDLYTHLYPADEDMESVRSKQAKVNEEADRARRPGGASLNALARAGVLSDEPDKMPHQSRLRPSETRSNTPARIDGVDGKINAQQPANDAAVVDPLPEAADQKIELLKSLLLLGALPEALYMLGRFPWLIDAFPDLTAHINRILRQCLSQLHDPDKPKGDEEDFQMAIKVPTANQRGVPKGDLRLTKFTQPKSRKWAQIEKNDVEDLSDGSVSMRFYWDEWISDIPICQTEDDLFTLCDTLLNLSGVNIGQDPAILVKLAALGKHSLAKDTSETNRNRWINLIKRIICPAVSFVGTNASTVQVVWDLLKVLPVDVRYSIYAEWYQGPTSRLPSISREFAVTRAQAKHVMKRLDKTNATKNAKEFEKICFSSPGVVWDVCLNQIESYDNLIDVIVECIRYLSLLACDVLSWTIISFLSREGRDRLSQTGFTANKWLQSLSTFTGRVYARHNVMNVTPVLRYVFDQIRQDNFTDLRILRDIITNMAGIASDKDFSESQLLAMAGGDALRACTLRQLGDRRHEREAPARRLMRSITQHDLAAPLLVAIAQQRQTCIFHQDVDDTKILGETVDEVVVVLSQYLDLLQEHLGQQEFETRIPDVVSLIRDFGIDMGMAFTIHRQNLTRKMLDYDAEHKLRLKPARLSDTGAKPLDSDIKMADVSEKAVIEESPANLGGESAPRTLTEDGSTSMPLTAKSPDTAGQDGDGQIWHPVLEELMSQLEPVLPEKTRSMISVSFCTTFWQLSSVDIMTVSSNYSDEHARQQAEYKAVLNNKDPHKRDETARKRKEIDGILESLSKEIQPQLRRYQHARARMIRERLHWFKGFHDKQDELHIGLIQDCFLPRLLLSPVDAQFAQKMLFLVHGLGAPNFRTGRLISRILHQKVLTNLIFQCTCREADNLGRFICETLRTLGEWHADRSVFEKNAHGPKKDLPGFASKFSADGKPEAFLEFEEFRRTLRRWHQGVFAALRTCLSSPEYMHVRNGIQVLTRVMKVFPAIDYMGQALSKELRDIGAREKKVRDDLSTAALSAFGQLKPREKSWKMVQDFCINEPGQSKQLPTASKTDEAKAISQPNDTVTIKTGRAGAEDGEDGEVPDAYMQDVTVDGADAATAKPKDEQKSSSRNIGADAELRDQGPNRTSTPQHRSGRLYDGAQEPRNPDSLKRKTDDSYQESPDSVKRSRFDDPSRLPRSDPHPPRNHNSDWAPSPRWNSHYRQADGPAPEDTRNAMHPPSMPRSDRHSYRSQEPPRGQRHQDVNYGRLNQDSELPASAPTALAPGRLSRPDFPPAHDRRQGGGHVQTHVQPERTDTPGSADRPTRSLETRRPDASSAPTTPAAEPSGVHPSRLSKIEPSQQRQPAQQTPAEPSGPTNLGPAAPPSAGPRGRFSDYPGSGASPTTREPPSGPSAAPVGRGAQRPGDTRQSFRMQDTLRPGGPAGPDPSGQRGDGSYGVPPTGAPAGRPSDLLQGRLDDMPAGRGMRGPPPTSGPPSGPPSSHRAPPSAPEVGVNSERAAMMHSDRSQRDEPRYARDGPRLQQDMPPGGRGTSVRGRGGFAQMDLMSRAFPSSERPPMSRGASASHSGPDPREGGEYANPYPTQHRQHRDDRPDLLTRDPSSMRRDDRNRTRDDHDGAHRPTPGLDPRAPPYEREPPRDLRDGAMRTPGPRENDFGGRLSRGGYDDSGPRGGDRSLRRGGGRDLVGEHPAAGLQDWPPREVGVRDRHGDERGNYGREDVMVPRQDTRGGPPLRRGGGPPFIDSRGDARRSGDFPRERREPMNGGSSNGGRKRDWNDDGPMGDAKRPQRRSMN